MVKSANGPCKHVSPSSKLNACANLHCYRLRQALHLRSKQTGRECSQSVRRRIRSVSKEGRIRRVNTCPIIPSRGVTLGIAIGVQRFHRHHCNRRDEENQVLESHCGGLWWLKGRKISAHQLQGLAPVSYHFKGGCVYHPDLSIKMVSAFAVHGLKFASTDTLPSSQLSLARSTSSFNFYLSMFLGKTRHLLVEAYGSRTISCSIWMR
jgi:hypothetical protein